MQENKIITIADHQKSEVQKLEAVIFEFNDTLLDLGEVRGLQKTLTLTEIVMIEKFIHLRDSKAYKGLPYKNSDGKTLTCQCLEDACNAYLGKSYDTLRKKSKRYKEMGRELYAQSLVTWTEQDYRIFGKLPEKTKLLQQAQKYLADGNTEKVAESLNDMQQQITQQQQTQKTAEAQLKIEQAEHASTQQSLDENRAKLDDNTKKLAQYETLGKKDVTAISTDINLRAFTISYQMTQAGNALRVLYDDISAMNKSDNRPDFASFDEQNNATWVVMMTEIKEGYRNFIQNYNFVNDVVGGYVPDPKPIMVGSDEFKALFEED